VNLLSQKIKTRQSHFWAMTVTATITSADIYFSAAFCEVSTFVIALGKIIFHFPAKINRSRGPSSAE
jgi:hypothetical protein